jgi:hypothetical protein
MGAAAAGAALAAEALPWAHAMPPAKHNNPATTPGIRLRMFFVIFNSYSVCP